MKYFNNIINNFKEFKNNNNKYFIIKLKNLKNNTVFS